MDILLNGTIVNGDTKLVYKSNPKKVGSLAFKRYEAYSKFATVEQYLTKCAKDESLKKYARADLRWDSEKGFLKFA